jgi:hypothetical protein
LRWRGLVRQSKRMSLQEFSPDALYCVRCHAKAAGQCATCQSLVCADCCEISGGASKRVAVCVSCFDEGRGELTSADWMLVLRPIFVALLGLSLIALSLLAVLSR